MFSFYHFLRSTSMKGIDKMKFTPEVIAALQTLKDSAESDFERHRIAVLEKDLNEPPVVEIVDDTHQKFDNICYKKDSTNHYRTQTNLHRAVYSYYFGDIPDGYIVHHIDFNAANNVIDNLQALTPSEHRAIHNLDEPKHYEVCQICGKSFLTLKKNAKFCSKDCGRQAYLIKNTCSVCGKIFIAKDKRHIYCSKQCRDEARNNRAKENDRKICTCKNCGEQYFYGDRHDKDFCSKSCRQSYDYHADKNQETRKCVICGKNFSVYKYKKTATCSLECRSKLAYINRQATHQENKVDK